MFGLFMMIDHNVRLYFKQVPKTMFILKKTEEFITGIWAVTYKNTIWYGTIN